jgi:hypothetical protein
LAIASPTSGGRSVGIVRSLTQTMEFSFSLVYQQRNNLAKDENGHLLADSQYILNEWKNYFSLLLNVHSVSDVRQIEVHTSDPLVPGSSRLEV